PVVSAPVDAGGDRGGVEERACVGPAQIGRARTVGDPPADLPDDLGFAFGQPHRAVDAQMDVDPGRSRGEADEEVLAPGLGAFEDVPIEQAGTGEATLRTGGCDAV